MSTFITLLIILLNLMQWAILIRVLLSWLPMMNIQVDRYNPFIKILYDITDPILLPLSKVARIGMIDLSPIVAFLVIGFLMRALTVL